MRRFVLVLISLACPSMAQKVIFSSGPCYQMCSRTVDKGYTIDLTRPGHVEVLDRDGLRLFQTLVMSPTSRPVSGISGGAIDTDGTVAVGAVWDVERGYAGGVMLYDRSGRQMRTIRTGRFMPQQVTFDPNHYLWVYGWQRDADDWVLEDRQDYPLLRRFSKDGTEEGKLLTRRRFPGWSGGVNMLRAAKDRIGLLVVPGSGEGESQWIEVDFDGKIIGNWPVGKTWFGDVAYTESGRLYTREWDAKTRRHRLEVFDRESGKWLPLMELDDNPEHEINYGNLVGTDGDQIVFSAAHDKLIWMQVK